MTASPSDIYEAARAIANAITPMGACPVEDEAGVCVGSLTEAVMGLTRSVVYMTQAIDRIAEAIDNLPGVTMPTAPTGDRNGNIEVRTCRVIVPCAGCNCAHGATVTIGQHPNQSDVSDAITRIEYSPELYTSLSHGLTHQDRWKWRRAGLHATIGKSLQALIDSGELLMGDDSTGDYVR